MRKDITRTFLVTEINLTVIKKATKEIESRLVTLSGDYTGSTEIEKGVVKAKLISTDEVVVEATVNRVYGEQRKMAVDTFLANSTLIKTLTKEELEKAKASDSEKDN